MYQVSANYKNKDGSHFSQLAGIASSDLAELVPLATNYFARNAKEETSELRDGIIVASVWIVDDEGKLICEI